jgi:riboflavin biosynthesis pyrimidine reductase
MTSDRPIDRLRPQPLSDLDDDELARAYQGLRSPWLRVNFVESVDGSAARGGFSKGLSDQADRRVFNLLRRLCDVVVVGSGTIRVEGYGGMRVDTPSEAWREAHGLAAQPRLAIVSNRLRLEPDAAVFARAVTRPLLITSNAAARERGGDFESVAEVLACGEDEVDPHVLVAALVARGLPRMLCEGGPSLFATLAEADVVDEVCLTVTSVIVGGAGPRILATAMPLDVPLRLAHVLAAGDTLLLRYFRGQWPGSPAAGGSDDGSYAASRDPSRIV